MGQLSGKSVIITGASRGIGAAAAEAMAGEGAAVLLLARSAGGDHRDRDPAAATPRAGRGDDLRRRRVQARWHAAVARADEVFWGGSTR